MSNVSVTKFAYTLNEFRALGGPCRARAYQLIDAGKLHAVKDGGRTLIPAAEVERYFRDLPAYQVAS
jgi:excisionase family DNA binding protein